MRGTWQTTSGGADWLAPLAGVLVAVAAAAAVYAVIVAILPVLLLILAPTLGVGVLIVASAIAWRIHRGPPGQRVPPWRQGALSQQAPRREVPRQAPRAVQRPSWPDRPAIEQPGGLHLHLHGVSAEDVAEILDRRHQGS